MIPWLKDLLYDKRNFANFARAGIGGLGLIGPDLVDLGQFGWWAGKALVVLAFMMRSSGDPNTKP